MGRWRRSVFRRNTDGPDKGLTVPVQVLDENEKSHCCSVTKYYETKDTETAGLGWQLKHQLMGVFETWGRLSHDKQHHASLVALRTCTVSVYVVSASNCAQMHELNAVFVTVDRRSVLLYILGNCMRHFMQLRELILRSRSWHLCGNYFVQLRQWWII